MFENARRAVANPRRRPAAQQPEPAFGRQDSRQHKPQFCLSVQAEACCAAVLCTADLALKPLQTAVDLWVTRQTAWTSSLHQGPATTVAAASAML